MGPYSGQPVLRREDARFVRGEATFVDDVDLPRLAHVVFVRSHHAHARLRAVTTDRALAAPGVATVLTAADLHGRAGALPQRAFPGSSIAPVPHPILAQDRVRYVGEAVAAVVAGTRAEALDAAERVEIDYEPLEPVLDARSGADGATKLHDELPDNVLVRSTQRGGDVDEAFAAAALTVGCSIHIPRVAAAPLEPRGAVATYDRGTDLLTVWCSSQDPHRPLADLSHVLARPADRIRLVVPDVGGSFGSKGALAPEAALAAVATMLLGRPVKWVEDRSENFLAAYQGRGLDADIELALDDGARMLAVRARLYADLGAYLYPSTPLPVHTTASLMTGPYAIEAAEVELIGLATSKVPTGPYRGAGRPEAALILERAVDVAARRLDIDPVELRRRNVIAADAFPHRTPLGLTYDSGDYRRVLDRLRQLADLERRRADQERARQDGRLVGIGTAMYVERGGGGWESAGIAVAPDGRVVARTGSSPQGQGHETTFAQIVADNLGVAIDDVTLRWGDSSVVARGVGTFGSRSVAMGGSALFVAAQRVRAKAAALAAHLLGAPVEALAWDGDRVGVAGEPRSLTLRELAAAAYEPARIPPGMELGLECDAVFTSENVFSAGAHLAVVEIDRATGALTVDAVLAVDDAGRVVNPLLAEGQVIGGIVQGLGQALIEKITYDGDGQQRAATFAEYALLSAADVPPIVAEFISTPTSVNPLGAKGIGEGGAIGAPAAVANAVADALAPLGVRHLDLPFTAEALWQALQDPSRAGLTSMSDRRCDDNLAV